MDSGGAGLLGSGSSGSVALSSGSAGSSASSLVLDCGSSCSLERSCDEAAAADRDEAGLSSSEEEARGHGVSASPPLSLLAKLTAASALVPFGWWRPGEFHALPRPLLHSTPSLGIILRQLPGATPTKRNASLVPHGEALLAHRYGTPRVFRCTHITSHVLTRRNKHELPTILRHDELHLAAVGHEKCRERVVVSPEVVEWLMGVPRGWTGTEPLSCGVVQQHAPGGALAAGVSAAAAQGGPAPQQKATLSLFSGCGMLDFGLSAWTRPVAYCEKCEDAAKVLRARMSDGSLHAAPVHRDITSMSAVHLRGQVDGLVMGFPCQDISWAGSKAGFDGERSVLVFEGLRLADEAQCAWLFLENVSGIRGMPGVWQPLFQALGSRGFTVQWCTLEASRVGSPQTRRRWFAVARRVGLGVSASLNPAGAAPPRARKDGKLGRFEEQSGIHFNGGRPPPARWLLPPSAYVAVEARLRMLGNAVVPLQAHLAAFLLDL